MAINSYKMGPGTLKLGTGGTTDVSCQLTSCTVVPSENVESGEAIDVLCGETLEAEENVTFTYALEGNMVQDIGAAGVVAYTWTNAGTFVDFEFIPNTVAARVVSGQVRLVPLSIGGEVKARPTSDFSWKATGSGGVGAPAFGAVGA